MLENEVEAAEGRDERAGDAVHDDHGEEEHHSCVLLAKTKLHRDGSPIAGHQTGDKV